MRERNLALKNGGALGKLETLSLLHDTSCTKSNPVS